MPRVLITSREGDADAIARRLERDLTDAFGYDNVLTDYIRPQPGMDVRGELARRLTHSHALLVVIGRFWEGSSALQDPTDTIRMCLELGLQAHGLLIVPVLVEGAVMPTPDRLPTSLQRFVEHKPFNLREKPDYDPDLARLMSTIQAQVVEDKTYGSTPARLETFSKPPAELARMAPPPPPRPSPPPPHYPPQAPLASPEVAKVVQRGVIALFFAFIGRAIGGFFGFIMSLFATAARQMVQSVVSFIMGIVIMIVVTGGLGLIGFSLLDNEFNITELIPQILEQINALIEQATSANNTTP